MKTSWTSLVAGITSALMLISQSGATLAAQPVVVENKAVPTTLAASLNPQAPPPPGYLTGPASGDALDIALNYLRANRATYHFTDADLADFVVSDRYTDAHNGLTHIYLVQRWQGIEVFNGILNFNIDSQGRILYVGNRWVPDLASGVNTARATLTAQQAVANAAAYNQLSITIPLQRLDFAAAPDQGTLFSSGGISQNPIPTKLVYDLSGKQPRLAWNVIIYTLNSQHWWNTRVDAVTGDVLSQNDWVVNENWDLIAAQAPTAASAATPATSAPTVAASLPITPVVDDSSYKVYPWPVESPNHTSPLPPADGRITVTQPADSLGSPFGWHDTNGAVGAEFTTTVGNNVQAYTDVDANNTPDANSSPAGGASLDFIFPLDLTQAPSTYRPAAVTNLFYWNNLMHDIPYRYGFNEAAGSFQVNNYGRGGLGNDSVQAEAQDGSGTDNANFATPADGSRPRMQMYLWSAPTPDKDGDIDNGIIAHEYGHGISNRLTGGPNNVSCLGNSEQMGEGWSDWQSIFMSLTPSENFVTGRGIGTYALDQATTGVGIRPARYSTNMAVNSYTYANLSGMAVPHGVGFVWNTMLYEVLAALTAKYGFNPDLYGAWNTGGNNLTYQLVTDGMKIQPCSPGFVDGRNAILAADVALTGGVNQCTIWTAFAKRGLGYSALQGSSSSTSDGTAAYDMPPGCMFLSAPAAQNVCQTQNAVYNFQVGAAFTSPVSMTVTGNPAPTTATFNPNPVTGTPTTTVLTIGNTNSAPVGSYTLEIRGNNVATQAVTTTLGIFAGSPSAPSLSSPANGAVNVALAPVLSWAAVAGAAGYNVQVATDAGFTNIVYSVTVTSPSAMVTPNLSGNSLYYWRVRSTNPCGTGTFTAAFNFTTVPVYCVAPNLAINDNATVTSTMTVSTTGTLLDLNVSVSGTHTYVGDLIFTVTKQAGPTLNLINRPGGGGCGNNNFDPELDDEGTDGTVQNQCRTSPTALYGRPTPNAALTAFDGLSFAGTWSLAIRDAATVDTGVLQQWCLVPTFASVSIVYGVGMTPPSTSQAGNPGQTLTYPLTVTNTGNASDTYTVTLSGNTFTSTAPLSVGPLAAGASTTLNVAVTLPANAAGGANDMVNVNVTSQGDPTKQANAMLTSTVNNVYGAGVSVANASQANYIGQVVTYTVTVTNTGNVSDSYTVALMGNTFTTTAPANVGPLAAWASTTFNVVVTIPMNATHNQLDTAMVMVTSQGNGAASSNTSVSTRAWRYFIFYPYVMK